MSRPVIVEYNRTIIRRYIYRSNWNIKNEWLYNMKLMNENTWNVYALIKKQVYYSI